jgi:glycosyltransferase involved in cell wall biosynthesis
MWEWFRGADPHWRHCDLFVCPNRRCLEVVRQYGWHNAVQLPWLLDLSRFPVRRIGGSGCLFVHNAGLVDRDDRKGTRDTIQAFMRVRRDDLRLLVRIQREVDLPKYDGRVEVRFGNLDQPGALYEQGDVAIQPSKLEGLGFMILEAVVSGLPVITLDHAPMNEYVLQPQMRVRKQWFKRRAYSTNWVKHSHLRLPQQADLVRKIAWCAQNDLTSISRANRQWAEETFDPGRLRQLWSEALAAAGGKGR